MDDSIRYLLDLAIILFAAKLFGTAGKKIGIPEVVGEILAGLLLGGAVLGLVLLLVRHGSAAQLITAQLTAMA